MVRSSAWLQQHIIKKHKDEIIAKGLTPGDDPYNRNRVPRHYLKEAYADFFASAPSWGHDGRWIDSRRGQTIKRSTNIPVAVLLGDINT